MAYIRKYGVIGWKRLDLHFARLMALFAMYNTSEKDENKLQDFLPSFISERYRTDPSLYESMFRKAEILEDKFFNIFQVSSYREIPGGQNPYWVPRVSARDSVKRGIEIIHDINDRYIYNENKDYFTTLEVSENMLDRSEGIIQQFLDNFSFV